MTGRIRRGTAADTGVLVELRAALFEALGSDAGGPDAPWREAAAAWFRRGLAPGADRIAVFVAEDPEDGVVACALGTLEERVPSPGDLAEVKGYVSMVSTLPAFRRRGHARACLAALLAWVDEATAATRIDLHATGESESLYRSLGFVSSPYPSLRRTRTRP